MFIYFLELFKCHSRLSMNLLSIVGEPNCLSYFVQYLEARSALSYIKFYLDTENFRNAALAQMRKEQENVGSNIDDNLRCEDSTCNVSVSSSNDEQCCHCPPLSVNMDVEDVRDDKDDMEEEYGIAVAKDVPELRILCDLSMHEPITDDEKSQICAATTKQITKCYKNTARDVKNPKVVTSSLSSNDNEQKNCANYLTRKDSKDSSTRISTASINDALIIYQKYLNKTSTLYLDIPVDIISKISLILCQKFEDCHQHKSRTPSGLTTDSGDECLPITADCFVEAQHFVLHKLEKEYLSDFLQSAYYSKYCIELVECGSLHIHDILHSEVTLFYFMEYLEQHDERDCLDFWSSAFNYRNSYLNSNECKTENEIEMRQDAMIIYEKFFSLQNKSGLWASSKLRAFVESIICSEGCICRCFDLPLKVVAVYLERKYLQRFLQSTLFGKYVNELKQRIQLDTKQSTAQLCNKSNTNYHSVGKGSRLRNASDKRSLYKRNQKCKSMPGMTISQQNTLLACVDRHQKGQHHPSTHFSDLPSISIDSKELMCPDLLWQRSHNSSVGEPLKFGHINSLGRFERDFLTPSDALSAAGQRPCLQQQWSSFVADGGNRFKRAMRKLVNMPEDKVQEEIAWQVAEMIVKDVTSVTMGGGQVPTPIMKTENNHTGSKQNDRCIYNILEPRKDIY